MTKTDYFISRITLEIRQNLKPSYIGAAILCLYLRHLYTSFTIPPETLQHFPKVSFFSVVKSLFMNEAVADRTKRLINPITTTGQKFYIVHKKALYHHYCTLLIFYVVQNSFYLDHILCRSYRCQIRIVKNR